MKTMKEAIIYDGKSFCVASACPRVIYNIEDKIVKIYDPEKPDSGSFTMTAGEWNSILKNAKPI